MKLFIDLGNVSSLDPTRERAKRSLAVSKDVRMGPTLDAWRGQGDATFPRHHRRLTSGMLTRKYCLTCNLSLFWFFFILNCVLKPSEAIRGCFLVAMARSGSVKSCFTYLHAINLYPRTSIHFVLHSILTSQFYQRNMGVRLDPSTFPRWENVWWGWRIISERSKNTWSRSESELSVMILYRKF